MVQVSFKFMQIEAIEPTGIPARSSTQYYSTQ